MKTFITGATGVIGRRAVHGMLANGHSVTALGRSPEKCAALSAAGATVLTIDLFDEHRMAHAMEGHDTVVNLATHIPSSPAKMMLPWSWKENDRVRRDGSRLLTTIAARSGVQRFIQESFAPIYEDRGDEWIDEKCAVRPAANSRTVLDAEHAAESFAAGRRSAVILRFAGLYGPDELMRQMLKMIRKGWAPLPGSPAAYVSSISQDDAASAVVAALSVSRGIYNVADDEPLRRADMFAALANAIGAGPPRSLPGWTTSLMGSLGELLSRSQRISNARFRAAAAWAPVFPDARQGFPVVIAELDRQTSEAAQRVASLHASVLPLTRIPRINKWVTSTCRT